MLQTLVLSVTYRCPIKCKYCGVNAGPHRKESMDLGMIKRLIDEARSLGTVQVVVFTGGEPFLLGEDLYRAVEYAGQCGFMTRIVTNAFWAVSGDAAFRVMNRMKNLGLTEINYSCDDFHQEFIPIERIKWACEAAEKVGMTALIAAKGLGNSTINPGYIESYFGGKVKRFNEKQRNKQGIYYEYGITVPVGWESENLSEDELLWPEDADCWKRPCQSVLKNIVITPLGDLSICCGIGSEDIPETVVGNINAHSMPDLLIKANHDLVINWLALEGPYGIMRFVKKKRPDIAFRDRYVNDCHLCHDIFSRQEIRDVLADSVGEMVPVLSMERAWVENHRDEIRNAYNGHPAGQEGREENACRYGLKQV